TRGPVRYAGRLVHAGAVIVVVPHKAVVVETAVTLRPAVGHGEERRALAPVLDRLGRRGIGARGRTGQASVASRIVIAIELKQGVDVDAWRRVGSGHAAVVAGGHVAADIGKCRCQGR